MYNYFEKSIKVVAHRGDSAHYPENTFLAFDSAQALGVDIVETDIHISRDNVVFIWHDDTTKSINGRDDLLTEMDWDDIKKLNAGSVFVDKNGEKPFENSAVHIMTLEEALVEFPEMRFNIDLKDKDERLVISTYNIIELHDAFERVILTSFHPINIKLLRALSPRVLTSFSSTEIRIWYALSRVGLTILARLFFDRVAPVVQCPRYSGHFEIADTKFIKSLHKSKVKIQVWTVNDPEEMKLLLDRNIDGIMTDDPRTLMELLKQ